MQLKTSFELILELFEDSREKTEVLRYHDAVNKFREKTGIKEPHCDFISFRSAKNRFYKNMLS